MRGFLDKTFAQIREAFARMERKNKRAMFIIASFIFIFAIVAVILLSQTTYVTLYNFQTIDQAERVYARLQGAGVAARRDGTQILVPDFAQERAYSEVRDAIGTPIFDASIMDGASGFGVTDMHQRALYARQLADDIRVQIMQSPRISNALVIVNPGETSPFRTATNLREASAAVMLTIIDGERLSQQEAETIAGLISAAVQGISYENIQISDSNLNHYRVGGVGEDFETVMNSRIAMKNMLEQQIKMSVEQVLARVFLRDNIEIIPSVTLNFDRVAEQTIEFQPPIAGELEGLVRSSSELYEMQLARLEAGGIPGTDANYMGMGEYPWGDLGEDELYRRAVIERNFELNETIRTIEHAEGTIESLTVSILINSEVHQEDMSEDIVNLISMGVDIAPENVAVVSLPFAEDNTFAEQFEAWEAHEVRMRQQELIMSIITWSVLLVLVVLVFILGLSIVNAMKSPQPVLADAMGVELIADGDLDIDTEALAAEIEAQKLADIDLNAKQQELGSIESFIDKDPGAVAQLLRNWLTDE